MRTIIVDDEQDAVDSLELIIEALLPDLEIVATYVNPEDALEGIPKEKPDLLFLDINMPELNGFELLEQLEDVNFHVIFITAYDEYAIKAFKFNVVDYLLKPLDIDELTGAVKRLSERGSNSAKTVDYKKLLQQVSKSKGNRISVSTSDGVYYIDLSKILYLTASGSYSNIILKETDDILVAKPLKEFECELDESFLRIHNSCLININYVKKLVKSDRWMAEMENGVTLPIARRKRAEFNELMSAITGKHID